MSDRSYGMPGLGGALGKCCLCGDTFMREILCYESVPSVRIDGIPQELFIHRRKCLAILKGIQEWKDLPPGPLREAWERRQP